MRHLLTRTALAAAIASVAVALLSASTPTFWQVSTRADFLKGEVENLSVDNDGRLSLGPSMALLYDSAAPFLWTAVEGAGGSVVLGSGNDGKVFRVDKDGKGTTLHDAPELEVHALAAAPDGSLYSATSPDGQIYRIDAAGAAKPFFKPDAKYIWSLAVDASGRVYAGTGEKGVIYRIAADGKGEAFYKTRAANVVALAFDAAGNLLAGTESPGRVFRIDREGKAFVLLESAFREIHSLRVGGDGVIYAVAVAAKGGGTSDERPPDTAAAEPIRAAASASVSAEITGFAVIDVAAPAAVDQKTTAAKVGPRGSRGAVYRIQPDGLWDIVWESADDTPYDVAFTPGRRPARGHRSQREDLQSDRRPAAGRARRSCTRPAGHPLPEQTERRDAPRDVEPRQAAEALPRSRRARDLRVGRARHADRIDLGRHFLEGLDAARHPDRSQDSVGQQPGSRRNVEPLVRPVS